MQSSKKYHLKLLRNVTQMTWTHTSLCNLGKNQCNVKSIFCYYLLATINLKDFSLPVCKCQVSLKILTSLKTSHFDQFWFPRKPKRNFVPLFLFWTITSRQVLYLLAKLLLTVYWKSFWYGHTYTIKSRIKKKVRKTFCNRNVGRNLRLVSSLKWYSWVRLV